jgi:hypothetical protein
MINKQDITELFLRLIELVEICPTDYRAFDPARNNINGKPGTPLTINH